MRYCEYCSRELPEGMRVNARFCDARCRRMGWADRTGYVRGNAGERLPRRHSGPSGLQVSYRKAVAVMQDTLERWLVEDGYRGDIVGFARAHAEGAMREALSASQRARLEDRRV